MPSNTHLRTKCVREYIFMPEKKYLSWENLNFISTIVNPWKIGRKSDR